MSAAGFSIPFSIEIFGFACSTCASRRPKVYRTLKGLAAHWEHVHLKGAKRAAGLEVDDARIIKPARDIDADAEQIELGAYEPGNLDGDY